MNNHIFKFNIKVFQNRVSFYQKNILAIIYLHNFVSIWFCSFISYCKVIFGNDLMGIFWIIFNSIFNGWRNNRVLMFEYVYVVHVLVERQEINSFI